MLTIREEKIMRKTKIVCTIGPTSQSEDIFHQLVLNGLNVARLNFPMGVMKSIRKESIQ